MVGAAQELIATRCRSVAARMANPALSKAFDRWRECAASRADKKAKMLRVLRRHFSEALQGVEPALGGVR